MVVCWSTMKAEILEAILIENQHRGIKHEGAAFLMSSETPLTLFVGIGHELLQLAKIARIELRKEVALVESTKSEVYYLAYESIEGVKLEARGESPKSAGFSR